MKARHVVALMLMILLPLGAALALGVQSVRADTSREAGLLSELYGERLARLGAACAQQTGQWRKDILASLETCRGLFTQAERSLSDQGIAARLADPRVVAACRRLAEDDPLIRQVFVLDQDGMVAWPLKDQASQREAAFLERAAAFLEGAWLPPRAESGRFEAAGGFHRWFWKDGLQLLYWLPVEGGFLCVELNRSALLASLAGSLTSPALADAEWESSLVRLDDEQGHAFLQWGGWQTDAASPSAQALARLSLAPPLDGWELAWYRDPQAGPGASQGSTALILALVGLCLSAVLLGAYAARSIGQRLREAGLRVSFVNQVSHELKTPLTNIQLYAELLGDRLQDHAGPEREYAAIIQREGQRLGRLIHNVLSFGRQEGQGKVDSLHFRNASPDECIQACLDSFSVSFAEKGLSLQTGLASPEPRDFDPDCLDQILGNLLSNVEKYARSGAALRVESRNPFGDATRLELRVRDWGPGLPPGAERRLFGAFERFHTQLSDAVGGTGLGLYLVRRLARQHGGDAWWEEPADGGGGCCFVVRLACPPPGQPGQGGKA